jgi:hypothetical protein
MTEAERVKAWRDRMRGGPPRVYTITTKKRHPSLLKRARDIQMAWDDPLRRAVMSRIKTVKKEP